jgi:HK97 family phage major capsid protein
MYPQLRMRPLPAALERKSLGDDDNVSVEIKAALGNLTKSVGNRISKVETSMADFVEQRKAIDKHLADLEKSLLHGGGDPNRKSTGPELKAFRHYVKTGDMPQLAVESKTMSAGVDPAGGYTVPSEINAAIEELAMKQSAMRRLLHGRSVDDGKLLENRQQARDDRAVGDGDAEPRSNGDARSRCDQLPGR